jgi:hypothetical protein
MRPATRRPSRTEPGRAAAGGVSDAFHTAYGRRRPRDARGHRRRLDRAAVRRGARRPEGGRPARRARGARRDGSAAADARTCRARRRPPQLHRRGGLRAPRPGGGVGNHHARRVLQRLHALPGRGQPGHAAAHLRVPVHDGGADRHGRVQRLALRRRFGPGRGRADGRARQPRLEVRAHPRAGHGQPGISPRGARHRPQPGPGSSPFPTAPTPARPCPRRWSAGTARTSPRW